MPLDSTGICICYNMVFSVIRECKTNINHVAALVYIVRVVNAWSTGLGGTMSITSSVNGVANAEKPSPAFLIPYLYI